MHKTDRTPVSYVLWEKHIITACRAAGILPSRYGSTTYVSCKGTTTYVVQWVCVF